MQQIRKNSGRILALLLSLIMLIGMMPIGTLTVFAAEDGTGHAEVHIIGRDELIAHSTVTLEEAQKLNISKYTSATSGGCTALHAIAATLKNAGLLDAMHCSGGYIDTIGDLEAGEPNAMSGWMYKVNDIIPDVSVAMRSLADGDEVILFWSEGMDEQFYLEFDKRTASVSTGEELTLTAQFAKLDMATSLGVPLDFKQQADTNMYMELYVNGERYPAALSNIATGKTASLYFAKPGKYVVTAKVTAYLNSYKDERACHFMTTPVCVVNVTGDEPEPAGGLSKLDIQIGENVHTIAIQPEVTDY